MAQKKNILMVYPKIPQDTYWSFNYSIHFMGKKASMPPLGIITVASMMPKEYDIKVVDMNIQPLKNEDIQWADAVFTSSMIVQKKSLEDVIKAVKPFNKTIVAGGPYPTQYFNEIKGVDHFILGEAESGVLNAFLKDFKEGKAKKVYARPVIRKKESERKIDEQALDELIKYFGNENSDIKVANEKPCMSLSPVPRFDLLKTESYISMTVQWTRGCPYHCEFCNEGTLFGHSTRLKSTERIVQELKKIYESGFHSSIFIVDDNLIGNKRKLKQILPEVIEFQKANDYPFYFYTEADISLAQDEELMAMMRDAGFNMAFIGLESPETEVLREMG
ncbi:B12-binding domain-containing radical SAM protein, partial [Candidatus Woesearchaeota archaeon]|nr:B12-binding domain-containing radical SAM protein [Candidatus Woesearchaeota archaeon]